MLHQHQQHLRIRHQIQPPHNLVMQPKQPPRALRPDHLKHQKMQQIIQPMEMRRVTEIQGKYDSL